MTDLKTKEYFLAIEQRSFFIKEILVAPEANTPWIIFLHDSLGSVKQWKQFPERIARQCKLNGLLIEREGHGQSSPMTQIRDQYYLHHEAFQVLPQILKKLEIQNPIL